jgi:membrane protease YdiL (CAAX protease family)
LELILLLLIYTLFLGVIPGYITYKLKSTGHDDILKPMAFVVLVIVLIAVVITGVQPDAGPKLPLPREWIPPTHEFRILADAYGMFGIVGIVLLILGIIVGYALAELKRG